MAKARILVVDDHIVVRMGLRTLIQSQADMEVAGEGSGADDAVALFESKHPDVVLLDLRMPDGGGIDAVRRIRAIDPAARVMILSSFGSEEEIYQSLQAGALGYILKDAESEELLEAIRQVHRGNPWVPPTLAARYADRSHRPELTARELEVLKCISHGYANKEIAYQLGVAENTVKNHINNLLTKLNARDRTQAAHLALSRGLLRLD